MRKIGLREFNRNFYKQILTPPFIVTRDKKPILLVVAYPDKVENIDKASIVFVDPAQFEMKPPESTFTEPMAHASGTPPTKTSLLDRVKSALARKLF